MMISRRNFIMTTLLAPVLALPVAGSGYKKKFRIKPSEKLRVIIETDAGGDPDDEQSLVRFLLYAGEFDIEGIIANRPLARPKENLNAVRDGLGIVKAEVNAYGSCYNFLKMNDKRMPSPGYLLARTVAGYDDTNDGVDLIINAVDSKDKRPVWFCNWGTDAGSAESCLKRALDKILLERGQEGYARFKKRLRLSSYDKFGSHTTSIDPPFPIWVDTFRPIIDNRRWYHRFNAIVAKAGGFDIERDVRTNHGPLGPLYPMNTNFNQKEGDTMSFLYLIPTGMNDPYEPDWGSWGGRYGQNEENPGKPYYWANLADRWNGTTSRDNTLARWAIALQNDFRARMDWCVKPPSECNHNPVAVMNGNKGKGIILLEALPGEEIILDSSGSYDPDGRKISSEWYQYPEAGTCKKEISLRVSGGKASFTAPSVDAPQTIHIILEMKNEGEPPLYCYRRAIITVNPK